MVNLFENIIINVNYFFILVLYEQTLYMSQNLTLLLNIPSKISNWGSIFTFFTVMFCYIQNQDHNDINLKTCMFLHTLMTVSRTLCYAIALFVKQLMKYGCSTQPNLFVHVSL
jgi:hypothetical protein